MIPFRKKKIAAGRKGGKSDDRKGLRRMLLS